MSFGTVSRVGCAETRASGEPQGSGEGCPSEEVVVSDLPRWRAPFATLVVGTFIFPRVPRSQLRAEPMCSVHVMQLLVTSAN